jgi:hypothetical protein
MRCVLVVAAIGSVACGRIGFDAGAAGDAADAPPTIAAVGPLACGVPRVIAEPARPPVGVGLAATADGVVAAWTLPVGTSAAGSVLEGVQLSISADAVTAGHGVTSRLPREVLDFGLVGDGAALPATRLLLSAPVDGGALFVALDAALRPTASATVSGASVSHHAVAAPAAPGAAFFAGWIKATGEVELSALDATANPTGTLSTQTAGPDANMPSTLAIQHADARDVVVWNSGRGGCAVWAFDDATTAPIIAAPRLYAPSGQCLHPTITRHPSHVNLLLWIDAGALHGQRGTDTDTFGVPFSIEPVAGELEIATAPSGFFLAVPLAGGKLLTEHEPAADERAGATPLGNVASPDGAPFRLIAYGAGALLLTVGADPGQPQFLLTRLCQP